MKETVHSMLRRCIGWDYSQPCIYMITVVLADRGSRALGSVVVDNEFMTRFDATAMNRLCQWLAGDGAATINYRGMTPANIDKTALHAVGEVVSKGSAGRDPGRGG